jgi:DNA-binding NtrC family response regulator
VVYVDDDTFARDALRMLLADWGCKAVIAQSLSDALRGLEGQGTPDVVLSDYSLQGDSVGTDVIEEIRRRYGPVAGAILTGESSAMRMRLAEELEYPVLGKPVMAQDLRTLLEVFKGIG